MAGNNFSLTDSTERYPWHDALWATLERQFERLPHGLLLRGRPGLGKHAFAVQLAQALLCAQPERGVACGHCHGCLLFAAGTHPDFAGIGLIDDAKNIAIDQIRALGDFLSLRPHSARHKVVLISPAEAMNLNAANSLLKLLEEPPLGSILLLVANRPARLPATVRSRCSQLLFKSPARALGLAWLQARPEAPAAPEKLLEIAGEAPLLAESLGRERISEKRIALWQDLDGLGRGRDEPVACAARWKALGARLCLECLYGFVADLIKGQLAGPSSERIGSEVAAHLSDGKNKYKISELYSFIDIIHEYYRQLGSSLDELLMLEDILIRWNRLRRLQ